MCALPARGWIGTGLLAIHLVGVTLRPVTSLLAADGSAGKGTARPMALGPCLPLSTLECAALRVELPFRLRWDAPQPGLTDRQGQGTGLTMAAPGTTPSQAGAAGPLVGPAQDPSPRLLVVRGRLTVATTPGSPPGDSGEGDVAGGLGVAVDATGALAIEAELELPKPLEAAPAGQAGLWFGQGGPGDVRLLAVTGPPGPQVWLASRARSVGIALPAAARIRLKLSVDPGALVVEAHYLLDGAAAWTPLGSLDVDPTPFTGLYLPGEARGPVSFAGILARHEPPAAPTSCAFASFTVSRVPARPARPRILGLNPPDGGSDVPVDGGVVTERVHLPNGGIDPRTLSPATVRLMEAGRAQVPATVNTSGGFDLISLQPRELLRPRAVYVFEVTDGLRDVSGAAFLPFRSEFTTGDAAAVPAGGPAFEQVPLGTTAGEYVTTLAIGPDRRLYAGTLDGRILRFDLHPDGTTGPKQVIDSLVRAEKAPRMLMGLAFDPASTAERPVLWVSHSEFDPTFLNGHDWTGKITRLEGPQLAAVQDYVTGLPRSALDHATNGIVFGPDGALYVSQGGNTGAGQADAAWMHRPERLLSAAVLRVDLAAIALPPRNVRTEEGGTYDPYAPGAPLTLFATGVRNAFDLVWHSNGQLYVPTNGANPGGTTPASVAGGRRPDGTTYAGPPVPALTGLPAQPDYVFRVERGGYYGHPNPARGEFVLNGGNPTPGAGNDPAEVPQYPAGTRPDPRWRGFGYAVGMHASPNGIIEYGGGAFDGGLKGRLLVVRYSLGDDIVVLTPGGASLDIVEAKAGLPGLMGLADPLDLVEDRSNGYLYVSEMPRDQPDRRHITLLRPRAAATGRPGAHR